MNKENRWDSLGNYFDEESVIINTVVNQVQAEIGRDIMIDPKISVSEIKSQATRRFIDLIEKGLLSEQEASKCYRKFAHMVDWYYSAE